MAKWMKKYGIEIPKRKPAPDYKGALQRAARHIQDVCLVSGCRHCVLNPLTCYVVRNKTQNGFCEEAIGAYFIEKAGGRK